MKNFEVFKPSRVLNERPSVLGLETEDFGVVGGVYLGSFITLHFFELELLALPIAALTVLVLIPIRMKYRRHSIRDFGKYSLIKFFRGGRFYDSSDY